MTRRRGSNFPAVSLDRVRAEAEENDLHFGIPVALRVTPEVTNYPFRALRNDNPLSPGPPIPLDLRIGVFRPGARHPRRQLGKQRLPSLRRERAKGGRYDRAGAGRRSRFMARPRESGEHSLPALGRSFMNFYARGEFTWLSMFSRLFTEPLHHPALGDIGRQVAVRYSSLLTFHLAHDADDSCSMQPL
jgi:hypothetical protein